MNILYNTFMAVCNRSLHKLCCGITGPAGRNGTNGANGLNGAPGPTGPTGPAGGLDVSFSQDKNGFQSIPAVNGSFSYNTLQNWAAFTFGRHNTGQFNITSGIFTAPNQGRYHFVGAAQAISIPDVGSLLGLRIINLTAGAVLAEQRLNASAVFDTNSGICLSLSEYTTLNVGDQVALQVAYFIQNNVAPDITIGDLFGLTRFEGYLVREVIFDTVISLL